MTTAGSELTEGVFYGYGVTPGYNALKLDRFREFLALCGQRHELSEIFSKHSELVLDCLVVFHEREHYMQHQTTIFGGLMWRLYQCLKVDIAYLGSMVDRSGSLEGISLPLHKWAKTHGRSHFYNNAPTNEDRSASVGSVVDITVDVAEIEQLLEFFNVMNGSLTLSQSEASAV